MLRREGKVNKIKDGMLIKGRHMGGLGKMYYDEIKKRKISRHAATQVADEYPDTYNTLSAVWYKAPPK